MANTPIPKSENLSSPESNFKAFLELVHILRRECPWDIKQTNESIGPLMIEETYEVQDAIRNGDWKELSKELGDILLHVVMHSVIASEDESKFDINDVISGIHTKLVSRHPHVFGEKEVSGEKEILDNWEKLKRKEGKKRTLDGIPSALPALLRAERIQTKAARVGFDWPDSEGAWAKVREELEELMVAKEKLGQKELEEEIGDVLFSVVNATRKEGMVAEELLAKTADKFKRRFEYIEAALEQEGKLMEQSTLSEMDSLWDEAKREGL
ncbi:MAG: nucleoside triphosphate pyrophosphohydrolase [Candidatus Kapaibacteriales bacterium]